MEIFSRLLFGHLLADFTFQTNFIARWKRESWKGLLAHVAIHPACYLFLTFPYINDAWFTVGGASYNGWVALLIITAAHLIEDGIRVSLVNRGWADNTAFYAWDQVVHIIVLWLVSPTAQPLVNVWPVLGILFVVVTHFATVTVWFIEKDITGREYPETEEKYISILQRLVVWLAFILPHPLWIILVIVIIGTFIRHIWTRRVDFSWTSVILGNALAIACGVVTRFGLNYHF